MNHWATKYIGKPWAHGESGPNRFDCWGFFRTVQRERYGVDVADTGVIPNDAMSVVRWIQTHDEMSNWTQVDQPQDGDAVLMARTKYPAHIGVWVKANGTEGVLHCMQGVGVVFSMIAHLRIAGWGRFTFYRRNA